MGAQGVIQFALGLQANDFLRNLGLSQGGILSLAGVAAQVRSAFGNVWEAINNGAALQDLRAATGETVTDLVRLQTAFEQVGANAGSVPMAIRTLQRALSGVTETGEKTETILQKIGLSTAQLNGMAGPEKFKAIAEALAKLDANTAQGVAQRLGGRGGATALLQASRDLEGFNAGLEKSRAAAEIIGRSAAAFDKIKDDLALLKTRTLGFWAGIAEGVAPSIQKVVDILGSADIESLGVRIGQTVGGAINLIASRDIPALTKVWEMVTEILGDTLLVGLTATFKVVAEAMVQTFATIGPAIGKLLSDAVASAFFGPEVRRAIALLMDGMAMLNPGFTNRNEAIQRFAKTLTQSPEDRQNEIFGELTKGLGAIGSTALQAGKDAFANLPKERFKELLDFIASFGAGITSEAGAPRKPGTGLDLGKGSASQDNRLNELQRIGAVFSNFGSGADTNQRIEDNTRRTADGVWNLAGVIQQAIQGTGAFATQGPPLRFSGL